MIKQKHFYLIRGLIRESRHWGEVPELLVSAFPGCRVTTIDIPGAGSEFRVKSSWTIADMVRRMRKTFLDNRTGNETPILVVISLGGMIGTQWMQDFPDDFAKAVLINTSFGDLSPLHHRMQPRALGWLLKSFVLENDQREARILQLVSNNPAVFRKNLQRWESIQADRPVRFDNTLRQLWAAASFRAGGWQPQVPVLLLAAKKDRLVNVKCSRSIASAWKAPLVEHPTAGHDISVDDPQWIVEQIRLFTEATAPT